MSSQNFCGAVCAGFVFFMFHAAPTNAGITTDAAVGLYSSADLFGTQEATDSSSSPGRLASTAFDLDIFNQFQRRVSSHSATALWTSPISADLTTSVTNYGGGTTNFTYAAVESRISDLVITRANGDSSSGTVRLSISYDYTNTGRNGIDFDVSLGSGRMARANSGPFIFGYNTSGNASDQIGTFIDIPLNTPLVLYQRYGSAVGFGSFDPAGVTYTSTASFTINGLVFDPSNPEGSDGYVFSSSTLGITNSSFGIPSPGAFTVLAVSGFVATRRRR